MLAGMDRDSQITEKLQQLEDRRAQLIAERDARAARKREIARKRLARAKYILGGAVMSYDASEGVSEPLSESLVEWLSQADTEWLQRHGFLSKPSTPKAKNSGESA